MPEFNTEKQIFDNITELAKVSALENLLESGVDANFIVPMIERLKVNVASGAAVADIIEEMRTYIKGDGKVLGTLRRYVGQVSHDSLIQYNRTLHTAIAEELQIEFYRYVGTRIRDTRPFCVRFLNDYFHKEEVAQLGRGIDPITGRPLSKELRQGRIRGTNASNIFTNAGGWRCRHEFTAVNTRFVPKEVLRKAVGKGYFSPTERQKQALGI